MNLQNKHIIVIGGTSGIGRAVVEMTHLYGAKVTLTSRSLEKAIQVAKEISDQIAGAALDVDSQESIDVFFKDLDKIDHIYVAAGSTWLGDIREGQLEHHMKAFDTRLLGSLRVVRAAADKMNPLGSITFTGGVSTDRPISGAWVSGLGTASAEQLARVLVMEFQGIRFNAIAPGYTDTPMWDDVMGEEKASILASVADTLPVKKIATSEEVASAVVFLMSNESITGETIHIDGGGRLI